MTREMIYNEAGEEIETRWAVAYEGFIADGYDDDGWNVHDMYTRDDAFSFYNFYNQYPELKVTVIDRYYGVEFRDGEWI